jgi:hypothetical protein
VALAQVAAGALPPPEEVLSRGARAAFARGHYRRAISDAATAAEMVLYRVVKEQVTPDDLSDNSFRGKLKNLDSQPLGGLVSLARDAGLSLGVDLDALDHLSALGNAAVHRAETPDALESLPALNTCIQLLGIHGPWKRSAYVPPKDSEWREITAGGDPVGEEQ